MPKFHIDDREVEVPAGGTILDGARALGIDVPNLCLQPGSEPTASCMACVVKLKVADGGRIVPSCSTRAVEGMRVESETDEVRRARRTALELLLSDHPGDCRGPCQHICPAGMDIPLMLRQIETDRLPDAIVTVKRHIALPACLGYVCHKPCEKGCRRTQADGRVPICLLKRYVAEVDLATGRPYLPPREPDSGRTVAVIGAGPAGLSAAYYLLQEGHACVLYDGRQEPGGALRYEMSEEELPRAVLDAECDVIRALGAGFRMGETISPAELADEHDAVLLATGPIESDTGERLGVETAGRSIRIDKETFETSTMGVFAAGSAVRPNRVIIQSVAHGRSVAGAIHRYFSEGSARGSAKPFSTRMGRPTQADLARMLADVSDAPPLAADHHAGLTPEEARVQAARCLRCDCRKHEECKLRVYCDAYGADPNRFKGGGRRFERHGNRGGVVYEPGKCISCGACVRIASQAGEQLGLSFIGRGFDVRVGVPFNGRLAEALRKTAAACAAACPTAALSPDNDG